MNRREFIETLDQALVCMGLEPCQDFVKEQLFLFNELLLKWNRRINLTGHKTAKESLEKNFIDSLALVPLMVKIKGKVLDIGSGAGFPGLVLKIYFSCLNFTFIEVDRKKTAFLATVIRELKITGAEILTEFLTIKNIKLLGLESRFEAVVSRATASVDHLFPLAKKCLKKDGIYLAMTSDEFFLEGEKEKIEECSYSLPFSNLKRKIIVLKNDKL